MNQRKQEPLESVYLETTFLSYLTGRPSRDVVATARQHLTREWWETERQRYGLYVSEVVLTEASAGDEHAASLRLEAVAGIPILKVGEEAKRLGAALLKGAELPEKAQLDALHIALATVHRVTYLLTWNCAHIANASMWARMDSVCQEHGFKLTTICTPDELMEAPEGHETDDQKNGPERPDR